MNAVSAATGAASVAAGAAADGAGVERGAEETTLAGEGAGRVVLTGARAAHAVQHHT